MNEKMAIQSMQIKSAAIIWLILYEPAAWLEISSKPQQHLGAIICSVTFVFL